MGEGLRPEGFEAYSSDEAVPIQRTMEQTGRCRCPRCDAVLGVGPPMGGGTMPGVSEVQCATCKLFTYVTEPPSTCKDG